jgi:hypothetical protein
MSLKYKLVVIGCSIILVLSFSVNGLSAAQSRFSSSMNQSRSRIAFYLIATDDEADPTILALDSPHTWPELESSFIVNILARHYIKFHVLVGFVPLRC